MERRGFLQKSISTAALAGVGITFSNAQNNPRSKELYEMRVYNMRRNMAPLDNYLSKALIPALNRLGASNIGVFNETSKSEPAQIYVVIPYKSFEDFGRITNALKTDREFETASADYTKIPVEQAVFERYDSSLMIAFDGLPAIRVPKKGPRLFELRIYEAYSEDALRRKVKMFNEGEFDIFDAVKINPVFFGENIIGKDMPCLTYLSVYDNMEEREKAWKAFLAHPDWQKMVKMPEYANTVSRIHRRFLDPLPYSQI